MRYSLVFTLLGVILIGKSAQDSTGAWPVVALVELWFASSFLTLAAVYGMKRAGFDVETRFDRKPCSWIRVFFLPYTLLGLGILALSRTFDREPAWNEVVPGVWLGRYPFRDESDKLSRLGINAIVNLCFEFTTRTGPDTADFARFPILDGTPPTPETFRQAVDRATSDRARAKTVLIHCAQGHGRSATIAAAVLVRLGLTNSVEEALVRVRTARPRARPSKDQCSALTSFLSATDE